MGSDHFLGKTAARTDLEEPENYTFGLPPYLFRATAKVPAQPHPTPLLEYGQSQIRLFAEPGIFL